MLTHSSADTRFTNAQFAIHSVVELVGARSIGARGIRSAPTLLRRRARMRRDFTRDNAMKRMDGMEH